MAKIAKVSLSADVKEFQQKIGETKKLLLDMSKLKINPTISDDFEKKFKEDLTKSAEQLEDKIKDIEKAYNKMASKGVDAYSDERAKKLVQEHSEYNKKLEETKKLLDDINKKQDPKTASSAPQKRGGGLISSMTGKAGQAASMLGLSLGFGGLISRGGSLARSEMGVQELTGGTTIGDKRSELGFSRSERVDRARGLAESAGRKMSSEELTSQVDFGEKLQRAFGISSGQQAGAMGAARRAGVEDQQKFLGNAVSDALVAGLEGSSISEYLGSMTSYMEGMSKGVDINDGSLRGFSGALANMDFFKKNPERIFDAINNIDAVFKGGDRFQQAQAALAITQVSGGTASPAEVEVRRQMGLFGSLDKDTMKSAGFSNKEIKALSTDGGEIVTQMFKNIMKEGSGEATGSQFQRFLTATNLEGNAGGGLEIFNKLKNNESLDLKDMDKLKGANKSPEERMNDQLNKTMNTHAGEVLKASAIIQDAVDKLAIELTTMTSKLIVGMDDLGVSFETLGKIIIASTIANTASGMMGGKGLSGLLGGASKLGVGGMAMKAGAVGMAGLAGYAVGTGINYGADKLTTEENQFGEKSNIFERGMGKAATLLPEGLGGISDEQYNLMYGNKSIDPKINQDVGGMSFDPSLAKPETESTDKNTDAILSLTERLGEVIRQSYKSGPRENVRTSMPMSSKRVGGR